MVSIIPTRIDKCWSFQESGNNAATVKACSINFVNPRTGVEAKGVVKSRYDDNMPSIFDGIFAMKCDPKKDDTCTINVDGMFYKECDPKKDKKCNVDVGKQLFSSNR